MTKKSKLYIGISFIASAIAMIIAFIGIDVKRKKAPILLPIIAIINFIVGIALLWDNFEKATKNPVIFKKIEKIKGNKSADDKIIKSDFGTINIIVPEMDELEYKLNIDIPQENQKN